MLKYLIARLWQNPLSRYGTIAALLLISFALIFSQRGNLYKYFSRKFSSPDWSDVVRHSSRPFAYEENEGKARDLTADGWRAVHKLAEKTGGSDDHKETLTGTVNRRPYAQFLSRSAEQQIFTLFNGLADGCGSLKSSVMISDRNDAFGELAHNKSAMGKMHSHMVATERELLRIHSEKVEAALQKKPDFIPAIELSEEIFRAACSLRDSAALWARALDYREYYLQKQLYDADSGRLYEKNPELFHTKSNEAFARDVIYRDLLQQYFNATRFRTPHDPAQLKNLRNAYAALGSAKALNALIAALLAEARNSPPPIAKKSHFELYALDYAGITENTDYLYALAETAVRGEEYMRAANIIANALRSGKIKDTNLQRDFERLRFHLELTLHAAENLSRF